MVIIFSGCDCGVFVVAIVEHLCNVLFKNSSESLMDTVTPSYVTKYRQKIYSIITDLAEKESHTK
jgi:hypothetical protein